MALLTFLVALVFLALAIVHAYWACGGRAGFDAVLPVRADGNRVFTPSGPATLGVALVLVVFAAVAAVLAATINTSVAFANVPRVMGLAIATMLCLRAVGDFRYVGFFKRLRDTPFARRDTWLFSPFSLVSGAIVGLAAVRGWAV